MQNELAQLNFSGGPLQNISILSHHLWLQLYKPLPNLTLPDQYNIPFPKPTGSHTTPAPNPDKLLKLNYLTVKWFFKNFQNNFQNKYGTTKVQLYQWNNLRPYTH